METPFSTFVAGALLLSAVVLTLATIRARRVGSLDKIPTIGYSGTFTSYISAIRFFFHAREIIQEGYDKYPGRAFKIPMLRKWMVVVSGPKMTEDIRKATDARLSFDAATQELIEIDYTMGKRIFEDPYHIGVLRSNLTRKLDECFPAVQEELAKACEDEIPATQDWAKILVTEKIMRIACRASNRLFIGEPLCQNPEWVALNIEYTIDVVKSALILNLFPEFLKPIVAPWVTPVEKQVQRAMRLLGPVIEERLAMQAKYGRDWPDKPNDFLAWVMDESYGNDERNNVRDLTVRMLGINFAAIHTTSIAFMVALQYLAAHPDLAEPLREEVETVANEHGWSRASLDKMSKADSFLKEAQRVMGTSPYNVVRKAVQDFVFSDGTVIPKGQLVSVAALPTHTDEANYPNAEEVQVFRFSKLKEGNEASVKYNMLTPSSTYLFFGHGRHACPGRFFAVTELKSLLSHILKTYDVKYEDGGKIPSQMWIGNAFILDRTVPLMCRKRRV